MLKCNLFLCFWIKTVKSADVVSGANCKSAFMLLVCCGWLLGYSGMKSWSLQWKSIGYFCLFYDKQIKTEQTNNISSICNSRPLINKLHETVYQMDLSQDPSLEHFSYIWHHLIVFRRLQTHTLFYTLVNTSVRSQFCKARK